MDILVSTQWLADNLAADDLAILDASKHLAETDRDAHAEFESAHIPGARFLDLDTLVDPASDTPSAIPDAAQFQQRMQKLGVNDGDRIVFYDDSDIHPSARAWFIARLHGVDQVAILDGGLAKWRAEDRPLEQGAASPPQGNFRSRPGIGAIRSKAEMLANLGQQDEQVLDARSTARFAGEKPEARAGVEPGHIPGSRNMPHAQIFAPDDTFRDRADLLEAFRQAGIDMDQPLVTTCGSGVTAAALLFAAELVGKHDVALYDGSWSEWGADPVTPKAKGTRREQV